MCLPPVTGLRSGGAICVVAMQEPTALPPVCGSCPMLGACELAMCARKRREGIPAHHPTRRTALLATQGRLLTRPPARRHTHPCDPPARRRAHYHGCHYYY